MELGEFQSKQDASAKAKSIQSVTELLVGETLDTSAKELTARILQAGMLEIYLGLTEAMLAGKLTVEIHNANEPILVQLFHGSRLLIEHPDGVIDDAILSSIADDSVRSHLRSRYFSMSVTEYSIMCLDLLIQTMESAVESSQVNARLASINEFIEKIKLVKDWRDNYKRDPNGVAFFVNVSPFLADGKHGVWQFQHRKAFPIPIYRLVSNRRTNIVQSIFQRKKVRSFVAYDYNLSNNIRFNMPYAAPRFWSAY